MKIIAYDSSDIDEYQPASFTHDDVEEILNDLENAII